MSAYFITGTSRGIGLELTKQVLSRGNSVIASSRKKTDFHQKMGSEFPDQFKWFEFDVSNDGHVEKIKSELDSPIDTLICNAGLLTGYGDAIEDVDLDAFKKLYDVNVFGVVRTIQAVLPSLKKASGAKVINISSKVGSISDNSSGQAYGYRSSKTAVNMINKSLSIELKPLGITSIVMHPGWVQTDMGGPHAEITADESATGIISVIESMTKVDSGKFYKWNGEQHPF